jgi:hypothetical protein
MNPFRRMGVGALCGFALALAFILIGLIRAGVALAYSHKVNFDGVVEPLAWYIVGFAFAGGFVGLLWPLSRLRPLRYMLGIVAAMCFMGAIVIGESGAPRGWSQDTLIGWIGLSAAFGLAVGLGIDRGMTPT